MKNKIHYLLSISLLSACNMYGDSLPTRPQVSGTATQSLVNKEQASAPAPKTSQPAQDKKNDKNNVDEKKQEAPIADVVDLSPGIAGLLYSLYPKELDEKTYVTVKGSKIISRTSRSVVKDGVVKAEASHTVTEDIVKIFNRGSVEQCFKTKLEDGTYVIELPKGTLVQAKAVDPVKAVLLGAAVVTVAAAIFGYKKGYITLPFGTKKNN